jgi:aspartyl-tRNA(Asn)/glutamyl-tRNA(Gln) amidotransferase subunit C
MNVTPTQVSYVADLANLDLTVEERERMVKDLNAILGFIDQLNELDTANVAPMAQVMAGISTEAGGQAHAYARRPDNVDARPSLPHEAALQNAPVADAHFFKVPKVIER